MKAYINKKTIKNLIIIILIITILSALVPVSVHAKTNTENGGKILTPIEDFALFLGDKVMQWLQNTFMSGDDIEVEEGKWEFKYSPAIIFSGEVPAFDINFIKPNDKTISITEKDGSNDSRETLASGSIINDIAETAAVKILKKLNCQEGSSEYETKKQEIIQLIKEKKSEAATNKNSDGWKSNFSYDGIKLEIQYDWYSSVFYIFSIGSQGTSTRTLESTAKVLQGTIASWYNALRRIALVGLLSVLVYVGIRIVTSSSAGDKAKYKAMIKDWIAAICILFTLHYIMSITITVVNEISNIFATGESDVLVDTLRGEIFSEKDRGIILAKTIMYLVIVVLTVTFTVQYLKRVIFMAFYTLIAPLITLTYPLDKIKDGQAQAFTMWIREYVYTALIQVIHLIIYTVMVGSALDIVSMYPLYAIIVMLFIKKADGIIKKMFGFDKAETVGTLGAAATGALVVNALNKIARKRRLEKKQLIGKCRRSRENKCKNYTK